MREDPMRATIHDRFDGLTPAWAALWARDPEATPFASPAWMLPWWAVFGTGELRAVALGDEGRLVGLAPMYVLPRAGRRVLLPVGAGIGDHLDPLAEPDRRAEVAAAVLDVMRSADADWDEAELLDLRTTPAPGAEPRACAPVLDIARGFEASVRPSALRHWRQAGRRASRLGRWEARPVPSAGAADAFEALCGLHARRWARDGRPGVLECPGVRAFHRAALPRLAAAGLLRMAELRIDGRVRGVHYGLADRRRAHAYVGGHDPDEDRQSFGTLLTGHAIRSAAEEGLAEFHFLRGDEAYKHAWGAEERRLAGLRVEPERPAREQGRRTRG
jgi:CelD/BcsL family acetyltransferase involved in cellulose biosynthesis